MPWQHIHNIIVQESNDMNSTWTVYFILLVALFLIYMPRKRKRRYIANRRIIKNRIADKKGIGREIMRELAERFVGKDVYIKLLEGTVDGVISEVTDSGIVLENNGNTQVVNLDYVMTIREYPHNKNGKRAAIWG